MFEYDVFLSHAAADASDADRVRAALIDAEFRVYCDRYDDPQLDRSKVSAATADVLRERMRVSNAMVYVVTANAQASKWMPWELGFFDGVRGKVLVYPIDAAARAAVKGQEYLSLFTILEPGSLEEHLRKEVETSHAKAARQPPLEPLQEADFLAALREARIFGPADFKATNGFGARIRDAAQSPYNLDQMLQIQRDVWIAWLRLWGFRP
jgi:hypothetical protein